MQWLRWPISILLIFLVPAFILLLVPKINGFGPDSLKVQLKEQRAYEQLSTLLHQENTQPNPGEAQVTDQALVVLRSALTSDYIETKSNQVIDDTAAWLNNKSGAAPELNLNDIKEQVLTAYPDAQIQIDQLRSDLAQAQQQIGQNPEPVDGLEGLNADGTTSTTEIAKILQSSESLDNFIEGDFTLSLGQALDPLYQAYRYYQRAVPILGLVIALLLIAYLFCIHGWASRLKHLGWLFITIAVVNGILSALFSVVILKIGLDVLVGMLPTQAEVAGSIGRATLQSVFSNYIQIESIITVIIFVIGLALIISTKIYTRRIRQETHEQTKSAEPSKMKPQEQSSLQTRPSTVS